MLAKIRELSAITTHLDCIVIRTKEKQMLERKPLMTKLAPDDPNEPIDVLRFEKEYSFWSVFMSRGRFALILMAMGAVCFMRGIVARNPQAVQRFLRKGLEVSDSEGTGDYTWHGIAPSENEAREFVQEVFPELAKPIPAVRAEKKRRMA